jgi:hypothetical protein
MAMKDTTLPNHKTKVVVIDPASAVAMAVAEDFNYYQGKTLSRRELIKLHIATDL